MQWSINAWGFRMSAADFDQISLWVKASEGGFVNNQRDPGGATNMGVTLRELSAYRGHICTVADVRNLQWPEAQAIMKTQYWAAVHGDDLPAGLDYCVMDAAYNSGQVQAIKWLQASLRVPVDGHYGLVTAQAVRGINDGKAAIESYDTARLGFLRHLRTWSVFGKGWFSRVNLVTARALVLAK
jgi:lysozyme family protein